MEKTVLDREFFSSRFNISDLAPFQALPARKRIIWLASFPKSGNTWARLFLSAYLSGEENADINQSIANNHQCNSAKLASVISKKPFETMTINEQIRSRVGIHRLYSRNHENLFVKTHSVVGDMGGAQFIDEESTVASIHIVRNPLSVLPSFAKHMGLELKDAAKAMSNTTSIAGGVEGAKAAATPQGSWSSHARSWIGAREKLNVLTVKYEDLHANGLENFSKMLAHARIAVEQEKVAKAMDATNFDKLKAQDLSKGFKERTNADKAAVFFRSGKIDGWKNELEESHVRLIIRDHWDAMSQLGYIEGDLIEMRDEYKHRQLEALVSRGIDIGIYAEDLNKLREQRGINRVSIGNSKKTSVSRVEAKKNKNAERRTSKRTFG